ncbi:MAG: hypothetical protein AAB393_14755, partial [Bacteroidota bacterium]
MSRDALVDIDFYCVPPDSSACHRVVGQLRRAVRHAQIRIKTPSLPNSAFLNGQEGPDSSIAVLLIDTSAQIEVDNITAIRAAQTSEDVVLPVLLVRSG